MQTAIPTLEDYASDPWRQDTLVTPDGHPLAVRLYEPVPGSRWRGSVLLAPAMGVPQTFYEGIATWLARQGWLAATFDYRGMGLSRQGPLRAVQADVMTWARLDAGTVLQHVADQAPGLPLTWVGHSLGGQILPFVPGRERVAKMVTVGSGSGYWRENAPPLRRRVWLLWFGIAPLTIPLFGYFPGSLFNMVGDLPAGVMQQWRRWCLHPEYAVGVEGDAAREAYAAVRTPIVSLSFTDDEFMSADNTASLHGFYANAPQVHLRIDPRDAGVRRIGHFGFFRRDQADRLWGRYLLPLLA